MWVHVNLKKSKHIKSSKCNWEKKSLWKKRQELLSFSPEDISLIDQQAGGREGTWSRVNQKWINKYEARPTPSHPRKYRPTPYYVCGSSKDLFDCLWWKTAKPKWHTLEELAFLKTNTQAIHHSLIDHEGQTDRASNVQVGHD